ncbi:MAG: NAD(+)/NADH kinase [Thermofilaceae archaeon]|nr:NAD(+)/NADH kinase [Thermofilaceae archaeon]MDW8004758.1 NAD(+)/NADH kinase [Thermofilaceae archaeon]
MRRAWIYAKATIDFNKLTLVEKALLESGLEVAVNPTYPIQSSLPRVTPIEALKWADLAIVIGGDGTFLKAFHETRGHIPMLGVNSGDSVGYLMEVLVSQFEYALQLVLTKNFKIEERLIGFATSGSWNSIFLNEIVITSLHHDKLVQFKVVVDDDPIIMGRLDGLITATPTGSTAYALSAGGPVIDLTLEAFALVPLAPFTALAKPIVISSKKDIRIEATEKCRLTVDGLDTRALEECSIRISESPTKLKFIKLPISENTWSRLYRRLVDLPPKLRLKPEHNQ